MDNNNEKCQQTVYNRLLLVLLGLSVLLMSACQQQLSNAYSATGGEQVRLELATLLPAFSRVAAVTVDDSPLGTLEASAEHIFFTPNPDTRGDAVIPFAITLNNGNTLQGKWFIRVRPEPVAAQHTAMHEWAMKGSHNSYHVWPPLVFHDSHQYTHPPLYEQLATHNVRVFELDIHQNPGNQRYEVYHIAAIDQVSSCYQLSRCLTEMRSWSEHNPNHTPVFVWLEIKDFTGGQRIDNLADLEQQIADVMEDRLYRPGDLQAGHDSIRDRLQNQAGWPMVSELQGKFVFILLNPERYGDDHSTVQAGLDTLFARAYPQDYEAPQAAITKLSLSDSSDITAARVNHLLIAANACGAPVDAERCLPGAEAGIAAGVNMIKTDDVTLPLSISQTHPL